MNCGRSLQHLVTDGAAFRPLPRLGRLGPGVCLGLTLQAPTGRVGKVWTMYNATDNVTHTGDTIGEVAHDRLYGRGAELTAAAREAALALV